MKIKKLLVIIVFPLLLIIGVYKYYELSTLRQVINLYNETLIQNAQELQGSTKTANLFSEFDKLLSNQQYEYQEMLNTYTNLINNMNIIISDHDNYLRFIQNNIKKIESYESKGSFLIGKSGDFTRNFTKAVKDYYLSRVEQTQDSLLQDYGLTNIFNVLKDNYILVTYDEGGTKNQKLFLENFGEISTLEKYNKPDYQFIHEDDLANSYPNMVRVLRQFRDFVRIYYSMTKYYVSGDLKSASSLYPKFEEVRADLNPNFIDMLSEGSERRLNLKRKTIDTDISIIKLIKNIKNEKLLLLPSVEIFSKFKDDFNICLLYSSKLSYFADVTSKYPVADSLNSLIKELATIAPKTDEIDKQFDSTYMSFSSSDKNIDIVCIDKTDNKRYTYSVRRDY